MELEIIRIATSAYRHGVSESRIIWVAEHCGRPLWVPDPESGRYELVLFLGADERGVVLEVIGRERPPGKVTIFHAMRMRDRYRRTYREVTG